MEKKIILIALVVLSAFCLSGLWGLISSDGFDSKIQQDYNVGAVKMTYAKCGEGIFRSDKTIVLSIGDRREVFHSFKEAKAFLRPKEGEPDIMVMLPEITPLKMDETFCDQSEAEKDRILLASTQT